MKKLIIYLFLLFPVILNAQEVAFQYGFGYGKFNLKDVRTIQNRLRNAAASIGARITDDFPAHHIQSVSIGGISASGRYHAGLNVAFLTTGGRVHVADYSGEYKMDMLLKGYRWGFFHRYYVPGNVPWANMYIQFEPGILSSRLRMEESLVIGAQKLTDESLSFRSTGLYLEPSTGVRFKPARWLHLFLGCGYEIDLGGKMKQIGRKDKVTYNGDDRIRWSGYRLNAGLIFAIPGSAFD
ncbi:MAG: hypothetical protein LBV26_06855 [Bacteroidales bacterium]|jgi:hypothetical protein|nr:hypothetical protein [Bacteroidales bacterium]